MEEIYLEEVASCAVMSSQVVCLGVFVRSIVGPTCGSSSFELVHHEIDMFFLGDISHVKELLNFIDPVQEGLDVKVSTERRNFDLHLVLV